MNDDKVEISMIVDGVVDLAISQRLNITVDEVWITTLLRRALTRNGFEDVVNDSMTFGNVCWELTDKIFERYWAMTS